MRTYLRDANEEVQDGIARALIGARLIEVMHPRDGIGQRAGELQDAIGRYAGEVWDPLYRSIAREATGEDEWRIVFGPAFLPDNISNRALVQTAALNLYSGCMYLSCLEGGFALVDQALALHECLVSLLDFDRVLVLAGSSARPSTEPF